jgi:tetratricopeptide (TPR) repeat protein
MKHLMRQLSQWVLGLMVLCIVPANLHALPFWGATGKNDAQEQYVYEQKDEAQEKKRYIIKLEQDKRKCELAIINTKTLIGRSKNRPYLPELYLRLAELYIEKSRVVFFLRKSLLADGGESALDQYEANMLKKQAIEIYQRILDQYPDFQYSDKVHFFMAHEYHELGQTDEMIAQYRTLLQKYPASLYAPEAQLLLGDYYFNQKQDVDESTRHYEAVLKYPKSPAVAAARYKLAWCRINQADFKGALELFEASVTSPQTSKDLDIDTYRRVDVRLESLVDMAFCFPEVYKKAPAEQALAYFKRYAWSRPVYTTVLEKLAYRYYVKKKWAQAAPLYRELASIRQDPEKLLEYAKHIFESVQALGTYRHAEKDVGIIVRALERQIYSVHMAEGDKKQLINDYELYARDIITHLHAKARKTSSKQDFEIAADAYSQYLDFFTESPATEQMAANYAEALFSAGRYLEAGKQYEKVTPAATANAKQRGETLYSAVISYYRALKNKDGLNFYQAAYAREGLRSMGKTYALEFPDSRQTPDVLFNVAWVSYDAGDFEVAVNDLSDFVDRYPEHQAATAAIHLVMDAHHLLENYDGMIRYGKSVLANARIKNAKLKQEIAQIVRGAESRVVSSITMAARDDWENTRQELIQVADQSEKTEMGEQALKALILSSKDQKDLATLFDAGDKLVRQYPSSAHLKDTLGILIDTSVSIGQLRLLADYLERLCKQYPQQDNSHAFILQAARIREGLGQYAKANQDYRRLLSGPKASTQVVDDVVFAMSDNLQELGQTAAAGKMLETYQQRLSPGGKVRALAKLAVINEDASRLSQAKRYRLQAQKAYRPEMGNRDPLLRDLMAELAYRQVVGTSGPYYKLRLKDTIDNKIVQRKAALLKKLEEGYQQVLTHKSPSWALKACFKANEINAEFADFLLNSPIPGDLTAEQKEQYRTLIRQKAQAYSDKAAQYVRTCVELARKWEICDPLLSGYFYPAEKPQGGAGALTSVSGNRASSEIGAGGLNDQTLVDLYRKLLGAPDDGHLNFLLAKAYLKQGDYRQAALVAKNTLAKLDSSQRQLKAGLLNLVGLSHLYCGRDPLAKETFKQALEADAGMAAARINLAGLYRHYGHGEKAAELLNNASATDLDSDEIHPRLGAVFNELVMVSP